MKYLSLDIETTGLSPKHPSRILQLSGVVEDSDKPEVPLKELLHFTCFIAHEEYTGQPYALWLNSWIFKELAAWEKTRWKVNKNITKYPVYFEREFIKPFREFLDQHFGTRDHINIAGKNAAGFDIQFLPADIQDWFRARVIDPGSVFVDWTKDRLPGLNDICTTFSLDAVTHDAYEDAMKVIEVLRKDY